VLEFFDKQGNTARYIRLDYHPDTSQFIDKITKRAYEAYK
jgi:hypothetical protein